MAFDDSPIFRTLYDEGLHDFAQEVPVTSPNHSARGGSRVRLVVLHTAEGARTTGALGRYFAKPGVQASSHVGIDDDRIELYVPYDRAAWTLRSGNPVSDNAELCGFAAWTRDQWINEHAPMLRLAAMWVRERCQVRAIPIVKLTPAQVAAGQAGVCGHIDWTLGMRDGSHTDPGPGFPWDVVMGLAANTNQPVPATARAAVEDDPMTSIPLIRYDGAGRFQEACGAEPGGRVTFGSTYGGTTWTVAALGADGAVLGYWPRVRTQNNRSEMRILPAGTSAVTVEGQRDNDGTRPWASAWACTSTR